MDITHPRRLPRIREQEHDRGLLYRVVRARLGITQKAMATILGVSRGTIVQRECFKRVYTVDEIQKLRKMSGLSWLEIGELIDSIEITN